MSRDSNQADPVGATWFLLFVAFLSSRDYRLLRRERVSWSLGQIPKDLIFHLTNGSQISTVSIFLVSRIFSFIDGWGYLLRIASPVWINLFWEATLDMLLFLCSSESCRTLGEAEGIPAYSAPLTPDRTARGPEPQGEPEHTPFKAWKVHISIVWRYLFNNISGLSLFSHIPK